MNFGTGSLPVEGRAIGPIGTATRLVAGAALIAGAFVDWVQSQSLVSAFLMVTLGWLALPAGLVALVKLRGKDKPPLNFGGPGAILIQAALIAIALAGVGWLSGGILLFFGASLLLAAARGYAGCEILAVSNLMFYRRDVMGCVLFTPIDRLDRAGRSS